MGTSSRPPAARAARAVQRAAPWSSPVLVGRRAELGVLEDELGRAAAGEFRLVLLVGEAGLGKSRLARELLARHREASGLYARAHPLGASVAFGLWAEAVDPFLQSLSDSEVLQVCGGLLDDLASLFVRIASVRGAVPERDPPVSRLLQGLAGLLRQLSRRAPLLVVLDDVHFADPSSWQALRYFARHLDDARLLVVAAGRPAELAQQEIAAQVLFELEEDGFVRRLGLTPLERPGIRELAQAITGQPAPAALIDWVAGRSRGNPLFAIGLLRALLDEGADLAAPRLRRLPDGLTERIALQVRRFGAPSRAVVELLAVAGRALSLSELTALAGMTLEEAGPALSGPAGAGIVIEEERGRELRYELHHPVVRDVIYQAAGGASRRALHRRVARFLLGSGHLAEAALHFARSAEPGDSEAVDVLLDAMRQAEQREAYREALDLQAELVELLPADDRRWLEVLDAMYWRAEWLIDHRAETHAPVAIRALRAIDGLLQDSSDHARRAIVKFRLASFLAWGTGELEAAQDACLAAGRLFTAAGDERQALLAARELGWVRGLRGDLAGMAAQAERVVEAADALGDRFVCMQGLAAVGYSATLRGLFAQAESALVRAAEIARQDEKPYRLTVVIGQLANNLAFQGRISEAVPLLEEAKAANPAYRDSILVELETCMRWKAGQFAAALAAACEAAAWAPGASSRRRAFGMACGALAAIETGDVVQARRLLARAHAPLGGRDWSYFLQFARYGDGVLAWYEGRAAECVAILRPAAARILEMEVRSWAAFVLFDLAEAAWQAGDAVAASAAAADLDAIAQVVEVPLCRGMAATGSAWASLTAGEPGHAVEQAREAIELLSLTECRGHLGRAYHVLGRSLPAQQRPEAVSALERAAAIAGEGSGAWRKARALDALRRLGSSGRRAAAAALGPGSLTRRERDVARLAASGMTTKQIAQALFLGERTVESHLGSAYAKLGVSSKLQLMRRTSGLGL